MNPEDEAYDRDKPVIGLADSSNEFLGYLDTLLAEVDAASEDSPATQTKVTTSSAATYIQKQSVRHAQVTTHSDTDPDDIESPSNQPGTVACMPGWASGAFQVLMFEISGVSLGVPLVTLAGILKWSDSACRLPGQPVWHLGVLTHRSQRVVAVDTTWLIMPERIEPDREDPGKTGSHLLLIGEGKYGLLIDKIKTTDRLQNRDVRWRHDSDRRSWLAGIITDQLSVLLNVDALLEKIKQHEH